MLELTHEQCEELKKRVVEKLCITSENESFDKLHAVITKIAIDATITTIREYERMKESSEADL